MTPHEHEWSWPFTGEVEHPWEKDRVVLVAVRVCDCGQVDAIRADHIDTPRMDERRAQLDAEYRAKKAAVA